MGYRSQVRSLIYGEPELIDTLLAKEKLAGEKGIQHMFDGFITVTETMTRVYTHTTNPDGTTESTPHETPMKVIDLEGTDWKWYDSYDDVKHWHALLAEADGLGLHYEFVRIGEETGDIETESSADAHYLLQVYTSIEASY